MGCRGSGHARKGHHKRGGPRRKGKKDPQAGILWQVQTPQTFRYTLIMEAHRKALEDNYIATDDSALVEYLGDRYI